MGDIPLGVSYYSADYFGRPEGFETGWFGGAPPEPYFKDTHSPRSGARTGVFLSTTGRRCSKDNYAWWRQRVGGVRDLFHVFRIDHILGFYRIYSFPWRPERNAEFLPLSPDEARARTGGACRDSSRAATTPRRIATPTAAMARPSCAWCSKPAGSTRLIGEDLGTVPDYVRPNLT